MSGGEGLPLRDADDGRVSVAGIENEIRRLWREAGKEGDEAVTRACLFTLVALVADEDEMERAERATRESASRNPARVILALAHPGDGPSEIHARVNAFCFVAGRNRRQVCHEEVRIEARGAAVESLPSAVRPLLVPDLPVVLLLPSDRLFSAGAARALVATADRIVFDSATCEPKTVRDLLASKTALSDLAFYRTLPWRRAVAALFDDRQGPRPHDIEGVEVAGRAPEAALLAAWIVEQSGAELATPDAVRVTPESGPSLVRVVRILAGTATLKVESRDGEIVSSIEAPDSCRPWREPTSELGEAELVEAALARASADPIIGRSLERALRFHPSAR